MPAGTGGMLSFGIKGDAKHCARFMEALKPVSYTHLDVYKRQKQIREGLKESEDITKIVVAYEPVWAIGTGRTATAEQANETIGFIRKTIGEMFCEKCAAKLRIQYGGSMNAKNCKELMAMPEIDGGLIGGASLKAPDFAAIVNYDK